MRLCRRSNREGPSRTSWRHTTPKGVRSVVWSIDHVDGAAGARAGAGGGNVEELILHCLCNRATAARCPVPIIADLDIYNFDPWDLPSQAVYGDSEWYFFSPRDRKYPNGIRPNRAPALGRPPQTSHPQRRRRCRRQQGSRLLQRPPAQGHQGGMDHAVPPPSTPSPSSSTLLRPIKFRNVSMRGRKKEGAKIMDPQFLIVIDVEAHDTGESST
ncbi:hypothetical protein ZWY2020_019770 [Hordeum vulgare]|nr:hypothetical protein ZWY2020_019770 [Hordeum vulgare]